MPTKVYGTGFFGAGEMSYVHANAIREVPNARLVGLWNRTAEKGRKRADEEGCKHYNTPEELVADPEIDVVFVLTNLETHLEFAKLALAAGKHVLVEKPLCATVAEVEELKACAEKTGLLCVPGHNMIHEEGIKRARKIIQSGNLGKIVLAYILYNIHHTEERAETLPGIVRQILTHNLYTMMFLAGRPKRVSGFKAVRHYKELDREDVAIVNVELDNGGLAHLCASFAADDLSVAPWTYTAKVIGTEGTTHYSYNDWVETRPGYSHSRMYAAYPASVTNEDTYFFEQCLVHGAKPLSDLDDAIWAQKAIEAIEKSIAEGITVDVV
jgi:predicted dehydrogenase